MLRAGTAGGTSGPTTHPIRLDKHLKLKSPNLMFALLLPVAAAGYSLLYLLFGGGLVGAVVIFFIAKMFGK